jgi:hypothetical protein
LPSPSSPSTERRSSAFVELNHKVTRRNRRELSAPAVLTDNGIHFTTPGNTSSAAPDIEAALEAGELVRAHAFEYACAQNDIDHRLTKPKRDLLGGCLEAQLLKPYSPASTFVSEGFMRTFFLPGSPALNPRPGA